MALREVTVEINATYIAKIYANSAEEAQRKMEAIVLSSLTPVSKEETILDVRPVKEAT